MNYKYIVYAPPYDEDSGGAIALHRLCHLINESGGEAYLHPSLPSFELHHHNVAQIGLYVKALYEATDLTRYRINSAFKTPVIPARETFVPGTDCIVIYPEIIFGNPLRAKNVVRWLLHNPGHHTGVIYYGPREIYYRYAEYFDEDFRFPGSETAELNLRIQYTPFDLYQPSPAEDGRERTGTAYCVRKGIGRPLIHHPADSILIDGKSHQEIASIFKSVTRFISYDPQTLYSHLAVIAGCESVVVPPDGVTKEQWKPNPEDRYGLAYGFDDLEFARATRHLAVERQLSLDRASRQSAVDFMAHVEGMMNRRYSAVESAK